MKELLKRADHILVGGHRGCECEYPENSIAALEQGKADGADYFEIDVQLSADDIPVIYHDVRLEGKTELTGYVHEYAEAQLRAVIPGFITLQEAMRWGRENDAWFGLELKGVPMDTWQQNMRCVERISEVLREEGMTERVFCFGLNYAVLKHLREVDKDVPIGIIAAQTPHNPVELMRDLDAIIYLGYIWQMTPQLIRELQEAGFYVDGAILKEEKWRKLARELGVDMFESDFPARDSKPVTPRVPH